MSDPRLIVALDFDAAEKALGLARALEPSRCRLKIGKELFTRTGPELVRRLQGEGFEIFLDLKYHDIPNTVVGACRAAAELGVWMFNVHALGGGAMMRAARSALDAYERPPRLMGVTLLTSIGAAELRDIGLSGSPSQQVCRLAALAQRSGLDGVVCSARELAALRERCREGFLFVTPGIRPVGAASHDQKRILGPREAIESGASYLVIGRAITAAPDPLRALEAIEAEIEPAGGERVSRAP